MTRELKSQNRPHWTLSLTQAQYQELQAELKQARSRANSGRALAAKYNIAQQTIYELRGMIERGEALPEIPGAERQQKLRGMLESGRYSDVEVAAACGVNRTTLVYWRNKWGLPGCSLRRWLQRKVEAEPLPRRAGMSCYADRVATEHSDLLDKPYHVARATLAARQRA